jgi:hypothetical protein
MSKVSFDGESRTISVLPGETDISIKTDIYSEWKNWVVGNAQYLPAVRVIGGDPIGGGLFAGDIYFLINGWQIRIPNNNVNVSGVIYHDDGIPVFVVDSGGSVISTVSSLVQTVQTVETGGSSGGNSLSLQDVRNAMTLGPTLPASADSIDAKLNDSLAAHSANAVVTSDIQFRITNLQLSLSSTTDLVETLLKFEKNRTVVDRTNKTLTVYDDDGVTPIRVFNLLDEGGQPSTDDIVERMPQ